jgi:hypothetical protein
MSPLIRDSSAEQGSVPVGILLFTDDRVVLTHGTGSLPIQPWGAPYTPDHHPHHTPKHILQQRVGSVLPSTLVYQRLETAGQIWISPGGRYASEHCRYSFVLSCPAVDVLLPISPHKRYTHGALIEKSKHRALLRQSPVARASDSPGLGDILMQTRFGEAPPDPT